jgi:acyl-CoA dehydrogenase
MNEISAIKVVAPTAMQTVVDMAIQIHGGADVSDDMLLTGPHVVARSLRLADAPDEVHCAMVAGTELRKCKHREAA